MRPRDARYNAIPLAEASNFDATVAYVATRSPISNTFARFQNAEQKKRDNMMKNNKTFFVPWETIHEANPQEILERREPVTMVPLLALATNERSLWIDCCNLRSDLLCPTPLGPGWPVTISPAGGSARTFAN